MVDVTHSNVTLRPKLGSWLPLLLVALFPVGLGVAALFEGDALGIFAIAGGAALVLYNLSSVTRLEEGTLSFSRYGMRLWSMDARRLMISDGLAGETPILPGYLFSADGVETRGIIKSLYLKAQWDALLEALHRCGASLSD